MQGVATRQHDAFSIGMTTTDDFQNADVLYAETLPALKAALARPPGAPRAIPIITGFLGRGINTGVRHLEEDLLPAQSQCTLILSGLCRCCAC